MSEPITLTERERAVFGSMIEYVRERCRNNARDGNQASGNAVSRWMEDWIASQPTESASPSRAPAEPIDICERLEASASEWADQQDEDAILSREAAAEIRRLREEARNRRVDLGGVLELLLERNGKVDLTSDVVSQVRNLLATERRAGIEAAAKYHDDQAAEWSEHYTKNGNDPSAREYAKQHSADAAAIRALADKPAPDARKGG